MAGDRVFLEGMRFYGYHGVHEEERRLGQRFVVDLVATVDLRPATAADDVARTVSYSDLYRSAKAIVEGSPYRLIETVAETIASTVLSDYPAIEDITVTVRKPEAPVRESVLDNVGVTIQRRREQETGHEMNEGGDGAREA